MNSKVKIDSISYLRKYNSYELALMLRNHKCDPDVAVIAAWWVRHNKPPKNWSKHLQTAIGKITQFRIEKKKFPIFSKEVFDWIMVNYKHNKTKGGNQSLISV